MTTPTRIPSNTPWRRSTPANTTDTRPRFANSMASIPVPQIEPEFDRILREANVSLADAHKYLFIREWCQRNRGRVWIDEGVLERMGMDIGRWDQ